MNTYIGYIKHCLSVNTFISTPGLRSSQSEVCCGMLTSNTEMLVFALPASSDLQFSPSLTFSVSSQYYLPPRATQILLKFLLLYIRKAAGSNLYEVNDAPTLRQV
jgi:hypothetical protein